MTRSRPHHKLSRSELVSVETEKFAAAFHAWRVGAGITQEMLAERLGVSKALLSAIETSRTNPSFEVLVIIRNAMGLPSLSLPGPFTTLTSGSDKP